jgi:hypothetical protein
MAPRNRRAYLLTTPIHKASSDFVPWCLNSWKSAAEPVQTESGNPLPGDLNDLLTGLLDGPNLGGHDCSGSPRNTFGLPNWIAMIKPLPRAREDVIIYRRDYHLALEIILAHLPMESIEECSGIKVPATPSVKNDADTTGKTLLEFRIRLYGATTKEFYEFVCEDCQKREGKRRGTPSLIDFKAEYDMIEPKDGKIRVEFRFCCYPKCHKRGDTEFLLVVSDPGVPTALRPDHTVG